DRYTVYVFDTLELRRAEFETDYEYTDETEVPYLLANGVRLARVMWEINPVPALDAGLVHVFFELGDHLGSTSVVLDQATGELVERSTFQAYGGPESDYRPTRWAGFREDYRFTGKEEDVEVGLQYFGKRFLNPLLGRWVSADPLAVHVPGEAGLNLYSYVSGSVLKNVDPLGLEEDQNQNVSFEANQSLPQGGSGDDTGNSTVVTVDAVTIEGQVPARAHTTIPDPGAAYQTPGGGGTSGWTTEAELAARPHVPSTTGEGGAAGIAPDPSAEIGEGVPNVPTDTELYGPSRSEAEPGWYLRTDDYIDTAVSGHVQLGVGFRVELGMRQYGRRSNEAYLSIPPVGGMGVGAGLSVGATFGTDDPNVSAAQTDRLNLGPIPLEVSHTRAGYDLGSEGLAEGASVGVGMVVGHSMDFQQDGFVVKVPLVAP